MDYRTRTPCRRVVGALLAALLAAGVATSDAPPVHAQGFGWFGGILGGGTPERSPSSPSYPGYRSRDGYFGGGPDDYRRPRGDSDDRAQRRRAQRRKRPAEAPRDAATAAPGTTAPKASKAEAKVFVDVFGDSFGQLLANGLDEALADRKEVAIVRKARGPSGLVNASYYDWPKAIGDMLKSAKGNSEKKAEPAGDKGQGGDKAAKSGDKAKQDVAKADGKKAETAKADIDESKREKIDVAVMMVGSNDRQPITQDGKTYQRGSDEWNAIYHKRVMAIAEAFQKRKIPLIWVGLPIVKDDEFADDLAALNEIYKDAAAKTGATYVDSWEVFSDDKGDFNAFGPDINGQTVRLRTAEGIFFTYAGARKLAHFVETHLRRDIDGKVPLPQLPTAEAPNGQKKVGEGDKSRDAKAPSVAMVKPEAGPIKNLAELPSAKDGLLMQSPTVPAEANIVTTAGKAETAPANRADNFRWPDSPKPGAAPKLPAPAAK